MSIDGAVTISSDGHTLSNANATLTLAAGSVLTLNSTRLIVETTSIPGGRSPQNSQAAPQNSQATIRLSGSDLTIQYGQYMPATLEFQDITQPDGSVTGSTVTIDSEGAAAGMFGAISNFSTYDQIVLTDAPTPETRIYLRLNDDGTTYSLVEEVPEWGDEISVLSSHVTLASGLSAADFTSSNTNGVLSLNCFLPGTMIRTPDGETAVQDLRPGNQVIVFVDGQEHVRTVTWAGMASARVSAGGPDDEAGYPVRVMKDALAKGVPYKDMLITPEHCLFLDGVLVPVRMLVNGRSIAYDRSLTAYDYFHIETEAHAVIMADGALTESYLDTGNRGVFNPLGNAVSVDGRIRDWETGAAAPLAVDRATVEPLYRRFADRAEAAKIGAGLPAPALTTDADLHLVTDRGQVIRKARDVDGQVLFMLPPGVESVRLLSRTSRPCDVTGPFVDDRRSLGVLASEMMLFDSGLTRVLDAHLTADTLEGWHALEQEGAASRWTAGDAVIPLGGRQPNSVGMLAIKILSAGPYLVQPEAVAAKIDRGSGGRPFFKRTASRRAAADTSQRRQANPRGEGSLSFSTMRRKASASLLLHTVQLHRPA